MSTEFNKQLASQFFALINAKDQDGYLGLIDDDALWWIAGNPEEMPAAGTLNKDQAGLMIAQINSNLAEGLRLTVKTLTAEEDRVSVEIESHGELRNGRIYNQQYHFLLRFRDGKIINVREYLDTQHTYATWFKKDNQAETA